MMESSQYIFVDELSSIEEDEPREIYAGNKTIVVGKVDGKVYAVDGICTHAYAELANGDLDGHCLYCPLHFASFDIRDGTVIEGPTDQPLSTYEVIVKDDQVWINMKGASSC
ncbi:Rieske (2Fe-2S) protein [Alteribacillus bidgolensis]|uniref:3-phenylpropionate/trans-cinnamate dioxygenase ferredoxin subunit n=1 Tax=Alteribacillus bidgolensis TaxID=930129 RepID=A0A1G8ECP1_9BACI|nr:non-heme iron oxygenase ferredoxin subunit [Alteribacillus bidgolensis]SDH67638.1 3-phenylpropionate/trans-cinnamate dioxygenase ferredoxin subunit [Alteribacillus bidgolensis]